MYFDETNNYFDIISEDEYKYNDTDFNVNVGTINFNREKNTYSSDEGFKLLCSFFLHKSKIV